MSQSINKVKVQIPGTMYYLQIAEDRGRWVLSLLLRGAVENEVIVSVFSKNGIQKGANELLNNSRLTIDPYPLQNVCNQLFNSAESSLPTPTAVQEEVIDSDEIAEIKQKLDYLETTLENVTEELKESVNNVTASLTALETDRVSRLEAEIANGGFKGSEGIYTSLIDRLDKIEESLAETKGDDRVPSLLTAIDALEIKVSQLEGATVTGSITEPMSTGTENVGGLKDDIGRLSLAFDSITQRLTKLEMKLNTISPPTTEGAITTPEPAPAKIKPPHIDDKPDAVE
jgi:tetrahydromethanopterin S-methyltransferase subunit G